MTDFVGSSHFDYESIPEGYYDAVTKAGNPIRRAWHLQKFERVLDCLPETCRSILDVGCFAGTFLSEIPESRFSRQLGVDILKSQIDYANQRYSTRFRKFMYVSGIERFDEVPCDFDCITIIEVIEHLTRKEIDRLFRQLVPKLRRGGKLVVSTPNYTSAWPALEVLVNRLSPVSYEEQHLTKFNYFTVERELARISDVFGSKLSMDFKTTTHFVSPFLAPVGLGFSRRVSRLYPHNRWRFPLGSLILLRFTRTG